MASFSRLGSCFKFAHAKFLNALSASLLITPSLLLSSLFLLSCIVQFKNPTFFFSRANLFCDFPFCHFSWTVIFGFFYNIWFTLSTVGLVHFKRETSFKPGITESMFNLSVKSWLCLSSSSLKAYSLYAAFLYKVYITICFTSCNKRCQPSQKFIDINVLSS